MMGHEGKGQGCDSIAERIYYFFCIYQLILLLYR